MDIVNLSVDDDALSFGDKCAELAFNRITSTALLTNHQVSKMVGSWVKDNLRAAWLDFEVDEDFLALAGSYAANRDDEVAQEGLLAKVCDLLQEAFSPFVEAGLCDAAVDSTEYTTLHLFDENFHLDYAERVRDLRSVFSR